MGEWCDKCGLAESSNRVEFSESVGAFTSQRWVQNVCHDCVNDFLVVNDEKWGVVIRSL